MTRSQTSTSWEAPDTSHAYDAPPAPVAAGPGAGPDIGAGLLTAVLVVLLGAPAGLLWALLSPKVAVLLTGSSVTLAGTDRDVFIAGDGVYLFVVLGVGLLAGAVAAVLGRRHGPGVVLGLTVGGLLAAYVAARTGEMIDAGSAQEAVTAGRSGVVELAVELRSTQAMLGWPVGALLGFLLPTLLRGERVSSG